MNESNLELSDYNSFCKNLNTGTVLYNLDSTNHWGEYLLVANITSLHINNMHTYTVFLLGLEKKEGKYIPHNRCISLTPEYANRVPFLKPVGYCKFRLVPILEDVDINVGLVTAYSTTNLHKFATNLSIRKPRAHKYDRNGKPIIKKPWN